MSIDTINKNNVDSLFGNMTLTYININFYVNYKKRKKIYKDAIHYTFFLGILGLKSKK